MSNVGIINTVRKSSLVHLGCYKKKYHRLGYLNNTHFFLTVLKARKSKIKLPADLVFAEGLIPGS